MKMENSNRALICRGCMKTDGLLLSMYDDDISEKLLPEKLAAVASIQIDKNDDLPNFLCTKCAYRTEVFYDFKLQVQKSEQQLHAMSEVQKNSLTNMTNNKTEEIKTLDAEYCSYNSSKRELKQIIPSVFFNTNNVSYMQDSLMHQEMNINLEEIENNINYKNHSQFLLISDKINENETSAVNYMLFSYISNSKETELKHKSITEIPFNIVKDNENNSNSNTKAKEITNDETFSKLEEKNDDTSDSDSDSYVDRNNSLLGTLNDTIVKIKELKLSDGKIQYQCTLCMHNYNELLEILYHTVDNHVPSSGPFYCVVCEKDCSNYKELRSHVKIHTGLSPYKCFICKKAYTTRRYLKRHMTCHTDFARYRCSKCGKRFKIKMDLENHVKTHANGAAFTCHQCDKSFNHKSVYKHHLITHLDPQGLCLLKYPCFICRKRFVNNRTLETHMRVHTGEKPFKCHICDRLFSQKGNLLTHIKIHSEPRRYTCDICGKRFNQRSTLRDHTLLHTGEKPHICSVCGLAFTFGAALRRHLWTHADMKPYGCVVCNARFCGKYDLNRHMKIHWNKLKSKQNKNKTHENNDNNITVESCQLQDDIEKENVDALFNLIEYT